MVIRFFCDCKNSPTITGDESNTENQQELTTGRSSSRTGYILVNYCISSLLCTRRLFQNERQPCLCLMVNYTIKPLFNQISRQQIKETSELFLITIYICFDSGSAIALYSIFSLFFRFKILPVCMIDCLVRHPIYSCQFYICSSFTYTYDYFAIIKSNKHQCSLQCLLQTIYGV